MISIGKISTSTGLTTDILTVLPFVGGDSSSPRVQPLKIKSGIKHSMFNIFITHIPYFRTETFQGSSSIRHLLCYSQVSHD